MIKFLHHYWAYLLLLLFLSLLIKAFYSVFTRRKFSMATDFRMVNFTLVVFYIQVVLGFIAYFTSHYFQGIRQGQMGEYMKSAPDRFVVVEHPIMMLFALLLAHYGYRRLKKARDSQKKWIDIIIFYGLAFIFILLRIPWDKL